MGMPGTNTSFLFQMIIFVSMRQSISLTTLSKAARFFSSCNHLTSRLAQSGGDLHFDFHIDSQERMEALGASLSATKKGDVICLSGTSCVFVVVKDMMRWKLIIFQRRSWCGKNFICTRFDLLIAAIT